MISATIKTINEHQLTTWRQCTLTTPNKQKTGNRITVGFGATTTDALQDAFRQII